MSRNKSIDLLRGLIMILMALDHASAFIARKHFTEIWGVEFEGYPSMIWWFTRFVSHLCAPGFFFLMGVGMYLFYLNRLEKGWSEKEIRYYFIKRGLVILLLMVFVELPAWAIGMSFNNAAQSAQAIPGINDGGFFFPTTVLFGLGLCMMISAYLLRLNFWILSVLTIASVAMSSWYISFQESDEIFSTLETIFLVPTISNYIMTLYPVFPWLGISLFGVLWAKIYSLLGQKIYKYSFYAGITFLFLFGMLKLISQGNFGWNETNNLIEVFTLVKYPSSLQFISMTMAINLLVLYLFSRVAVKFKMEVLHIFGRTAMFFYLLHLYVYGLLGAIFPNGSGLIILYAIWLVALIPIYFACRWFLEFKKKKSPDSIWRMI